MELNRLLKDVTNLNDYITATQDILNKYKNLKVTLNIATVLTLKKIRSLEIEYLNKCDENGVACIMFERLLATPPSKIWGVLAKELVCLLQYWLEAVRKHFVNYSTRWWMFLKLILMFIKELRLKDPTIPNMLVELTAECLLDLATAPRPDIFQRHEILHCLNMVCAESGRETRFVMRTKFGDYFVKLAALMATSGYLPFQNSALECLLRWLVPRQGRSLRTAAADKWLPPDLCPLPARNLFLSRNWMNFFQDARDFLNALNKGNGLVTSVICRRLTIGDIVLINGTERQQTWIDFNTSGKSLSVLLDPIVLKVFGVTDHRACETLHIDDDLTETAIIRREPLGLTLTLSMVRAPCIRPTDISTGDKRQLTAVLSSQTDLRTLDGAMRNIFGGKYQLLMDLDTDLTQSPQRSYNNNKNEFNSEEETRFSHPVEVRRKQSGYVVRNRNTGGTVSPSTASTSSLLQLKDRLAALPLYNFDKEPVSVCAQPALSNVIELSEQDDHSIHTATTVKFQPYGVCNRNVKIPSDQKPTPEKKSRSDGETVKRKYKGGRRLLSPVVSDDNATSLLLVATVGSTNDAVIDETIERLSKSKDFEEDNIINLLVQEALQANPKSREVSDSGINTDEKKSQEGSEFIDETPSEIKESRSKVPLKKICNVSKSTTDDESNTEAINETPAFVNTRKNIRNFNKPETTVEVGAEKQTFHLKAVEEFFSQHIASNARGEIVISPTLAKKINETSSEASEICDDEDVKTDLEQAIFNDIAIIDCLNDMVDKVCSDLDKCTEYLFNKNVSAAATGTVQVEELQTAKDKRYGTPKSTPLEAQREKKNIKLKKKRVKKRRVTNKIKNVGQECTKKMSTIIEQREEDTFVEEIHPETGKDVVNVPSTETKPETPYANETGTPLARRKRKLYSPKDDDVEKEIQQCRIEESSDDVPLSKVKACKNPSTTAICYRDLENERKKHTRLRRSRTSKAKVIEQPSPRTLKMNSKFDNLKQIVESGEKITLVDKSATDVYNFTSESDDDDFQKKKDIKKRLPTTTGKKSSSTRIAKESESSYEGASKTKIVKRKKVTKRANKRTTEAKAVVIDLVNLDLVDERMREAVREELNTSITIEHSKNLAPMEIEPTLKEVPQMEEIHDSVSNDTFASKKITKKTQMEPHNSASNETLEPRKRVYKRTKKTKVEHDDKSYDTTASNKKVTRKANKNTDLLLIKKEKGMSKKDKAITSFVIEDERTSSPLPGLVVETVAKNKEDNNDLLTTNMLQKFKKIFKEGPDVINDSITTQNMLSDVERLNSAPNHTSIADDIYFVDDNKENVDDNTDTDKYRKRKKAVEPKASAHSRKKITSELADQFIAIVDIPNVNQSIQSIASYEINAHGDFDEAPPNTETIKEVVHPRELQDMEQSMKDYFTKLTREIHNSTCKDRESTRSAEGKEVSAIMREEKRVIVSPEISIKRLSFEDISRWMPSRRTSDTDSQQSSYKLKSQTKQKDVNSPNARSQTELNVNSTVTTPKPADQTRNPEENSNSASIKLKSPKVPIERMSFEEFEKWLPMPKSFEGNENDNSLRKNRSGSLKLRYRIRSNVADTSEAESMAKQKEFVNNKNTANKSSKSKRAETDKDSDSSVTNTRKLRQKTSLSKDDRKVSDEVKKCIDVPKSIPKDNLQNLESTKERTNSQSSYVKTAKKQAMKTVERDSESPTKIKRAKRATISPINLHYDLAPIKVHDSSVDGECLKKYSLRDASKPKSTKYSLRNATESKSIESTKESIRQMKRKSSPILSEPKRRYREPKSSEPRRFDIPKKQTEISEKVIVSESGPSVSSVNDWFRRTGPLDRGDGDASLLYKDIIQNVMEKLNTTIVEINRNTSKKFVNLFVEAHKNISDQKDECRKQYKREVTDLLNQMFGLLKTAVEKFDDLERKSQAQDHDFLEKLKKQAFHLISEDCKQKRVMVQLLEEDVQAVMDHINRSRSTGSSQNVL